MTVFRSVVFNVAFYLVLFVYLIAALPTLLLPRGALLWMVKNWSRVNLAMLRLICGLHCEFRGAGENSAGRGAGRLQASVAVGDLRADHDAERPGLYPQARAVVDSVLRLVRVEGGHDPGRSRRALAGADCDDRARQEEIAKGRQIIIFPEGTRRAPGAEPKYKFGVAFLYTELGIPCVPVALNSGLFWPRRSFMRYPGTVRVEFLDPIAPGLDRQVFFDKLQARGRNADRGAGGDGRARQRSSGSESGFPPAREWLRKPAPASALPPRPSAARPARAVPRRGSRAPRVRRPSPAHNPRLAPERPWPCRIRCRR